ncbi:ABC transporter ATP-binding protein/permease [Kribbella sp. NBC_01505]|uniref:ABC transporter ATP-binding protein n=1 Tax=Kribbella sp. NBC_01505 TaxID=2903580 RepID=UPI00386653BB
MRQAWRGMCLVIVTAIRVGPWQSVLCLFETLGKVLAALSPLFVGIFASGALEQDLGRMLFAAAALVGATAANTALQAVGVNARVQQMELVGHTFDAQIAEITARIPTLDHLETARYLDELQILRENENALGGALNTVINTFNTLAFAISILLVAVSADWRLLILIAVGAARLLTAKWSLRWEKTAEEDSAADGRLSRHLIDLTSSPVAGAETRIFGHQRQLRQRIMTSVTNWRRPVVRSADRNAALSAAHTVLFFATAVVLLIWMTRDLLAGTVSIQSLVIAVGVLQSLQTVSSSFVGAIGDLAKVGRNCARFLWLRDYEAEVSAVHTGRQMPPDRLQDGIRIEGLSYSYGDSGRDSLTDISLHLPAGAVVALVGENGAGKSTLVKLLAGLYRPVQGRILVDNQDLAEVDLTAWRARMSSAFQDYAKLELTAQRSVGAGEIAVLDNQERVHQALHAAAAEDVVIALPNGLGTQLGTTWPGGVDLSGGQWQRIAIARGMMRQAPLLLLLDEPTSALDAATEHELFERYATAARQASRGGGVTLLVTHRFSTVAAADLVVVLDQGRVSEVGTHAELIANRGHYAELYELQARGYR